MILKVAISVPEMKPDFVASNSGKSDRNFDQAIGGSPTIQINTIGYLFRRVT